MAYSVLVNHPDLLVIITKAISAMTEQHGYDQKDMDMMMGL
jgi:hypothetical protein